MICLQNSTVREVITGVSDEKKFELTMIQSAITFSDAWNAPRLMHLTVNTESKQHTHKVLLAIIKLFQDSLHVTRGMDSAELFECSHTLLNRYPCEALEDFVLAFKRAKTKGLKFYNSFSCQDVFEILRDYFDSKAQYLENANRLQFTDHEKGRNNNTISSPISEEMKAVYKKFSERINEPTFRLLSPMALEIAKEQARKILSETQIVEEWVYIENSIESL